MKDKTDLILIGIKSKHRTLIDNRIIKAKFCSSNNNSSIIKGQLFMEYVRKINRADDVSLNVDMNAFVGRASVNQ